MNQRRKEFAELTSLEKLRVTDAIGESRRRNEIAHDYMKAMCRAFEYSHMEPSFVAERAFALADEYLERRSSLDIEEHLPWTEPKKEP